MPAPEAEIFQHYRVLRRDDGSLWELGRGAMGVTWKAEDTNLHTAVALKVINSLLLDNPAARERFIREARAAASLRHRNVAAVHHLGQDGNTFFYAMEFIDGVTVTALIREHGPQPWRRVLRHALQVSHALMAAHDKRLVHRDLKPDNLMLVAEAGADDLVVKVIDFGLAKSLAEIDGSVVSLSGSGFIGTPLYASPEQCEEIAPDIRSDIYSLGVVIWYALTGAPVFVGPLGKVFAQHIGGVPPWEKLPADLPASVRALLVRLLAKDRAERPQTPAELRREIELCLLGPDGSGTTTIIGASVSVPAAAPPAPPVVIDPEPALIDSSRDTLVETPAAKPAGDGTLPTLAGFPKPRPTIEPAPAQPGQPSPKAADGTSIPPDEPARETENPGGEIRPELTLATPAVVATRPWSWRRPALASALVIVLAAAACAAWKFSGRPGLIGWPAQPSSSTTETPPGPVARPAVSPLPASAVPASTPDPRPAQARSWIAAARQAIAGAPDSPNKLFALDAIGAALARTGDIDAAAEIARTIGDESRRRSVLTAISLARAKAGDFAAANESLGEALRLARITEPAGEKDAALRDVASAVGKGGGLNAALEIVPSIADAGYQSSALGNITAAMVRAGNLAVAQRVAATIPNEPAKSSAQRRIAAFQTASGDLAAALGTARRIQDAAEKSAALGDLACARVRSGDAAGGQAMFADALQAARVVREKWLRADALGDVAAARFRAGDQAGAAQTLAEALQVAAGISDSYDRDSTIGYLAGAQAKAGDTASAVETARKIRDPFRLAGATGEIAVAQARSGDPAASAKSFAGALALARGIKDDSSRLAALQSLAAAQAKAADFAGADRTIAFLPDGVPRARGYTDAVAALFPEDLDR